jgi:hypothetical protein
MAVNWRHSSILLKDAIGMVEAKSLPTMGRACSPHDFMGAVVLGR